MKRLLVVLVQSGSEDRQGVSESKEAVSFHKRAWSCVPPMLLGLAPSLELRGKGACAPIWLADRES